MKIYQTTRKIRIYITKKGEDPKFLTLEDATAQQVEDMCKELILKQKLSLFEDGFMTGINIKEFLGASRKASKRVSFRGLSVKKVYDIIVDHVNSLQPGKKK